MALNEYIEDGQQLYSWMQNATNGKFRAKIAFDGVLVSTKVRREVLTSTEQGKLISQGRVVPINFENMGAGVWRAYVDYFYNKEVL